MKHKKIIYTILSIFVLMLLSTPITMAANYNQMMYKNYFAEAIANKFNLSTSDAQCVIDELLATQKNNWFNNHYHLPIDKLAQALSDGKLTQAQVNLIKAKIAELKTANEAVHKLTKKERMAAMKKQMEDLKKWANDNNIALEYVMGRYGLIGPGAGLGMNEHRSNRQGPNKR